MEIYEVMLDSKQYAQLKSMLIEDEIYSPVIDGWSTLEIVLKESAKALDLLRFMTKQIFPEDENYFVRQIGRNWANIRLEKDCAFRIYKIKEEGLK